MCQILAIRQVVSQQFFWHKGEGSSLGILHGHSETASERGGLETASAAKWAVRWAIGAIRPIVSLKVSRTD